MEDESTSLVEVTEAISAVKRLSELSERMRTKLFGFGENDISHIDNIIDALHELDLQKCHAKDVLETETIKCAAVRHKLMHYPDEINREIHEAVLTARQSNEAAIGKIKRQLEQLSGEADKVEELADRVDAENVQLRPELSALKLDFDANFARLNDLLAEKAACQIELNDMRESVRRANARIVDLEEDSVLLAERMVEERQQHADTLRSLREETTQIEQHLSSCVAKEDEKRREFLAVKEILEQSDLELGDAVQKHNDLEHEIAMLQVQQQDTAKEQAKIQINKEQLKSGIEVLSAQSRSMASEHQAQVAELQKTLEDLEVRTQQQTVVKEKAVAKKTEVTVRTVIIQSNEDSSKKSQTTEATLKEAKQKLTAKSMDVVKMRQEILDMEGRRAELEDAERAEKEGWLNPSELLEGNSVLDYNKQIAEWKEKLEQERTERLTVESVNDKLRADIKQFNEEDAAEVNAINSQIEELKREKVALEQEQNRLQSTMRSDEARQSSLRARLLSQRNQLKELRSTLEAEADRLATETERLRQESATRNAELTNLKPKFAEFERFYQRAIVDYDALKRSLAALKNRRTKLEDSSKRAGEEIQRLGGEIDSLRRDKERRIAQSAAELDDMAEERIRVEREIYALGCKLQTVLSENAKLTDGVDRLERQMRSMQLTWERAVPAKARIEQRRDSLGRQLRSGRERDSQLAVSFQETDRKFLSSLTIIINDTEARRLILEVVSDGLDKELNYLEDFLKTSVE